MACATMSIELKDPLVCARGFFLAIRYNIPMTLPTLDITGGLKHQRQAAHLVTEWCIEHLAFNYRDFYVKIVLSTRPSEDHYGYCQEVDQHKYKILVRTNQPMRQWIMTLVHELIHLRQYTHNEWEGDGEDEAWGRQEQLTDELWASDLL